MVAGEADVVNPIGPLPTINTDLDSFGSAPARDEVLARNGCLGTATTTYDSRLSGRDELHRSPRRISRRLLPA
jgi:hypothetical protein